MFTVGIFLVSLFDSEETTLPFLVVLLVVSLIHKHIQVHKSHSIQLFNSPISPVVLYSIKHSDTDISDHSKSTDLLFLTFAGFQRRQYHIPVIAWRGEN